MRETGRNDLNVPARVLCVFVCVWVQTHCTRTMHPCRQLAVLFYIGCTDKNEVSLHSAWEREKKRVMKAWPMPVLHAEIGHVAYTCPQWTAAARMSSLSVQMLIVHKHRYERLGWPCARETSERMNTRLSARTLLHLAWAQVGETRVMLTQVAWTLAILWILMAWTQGVSTPQFQIQGLWTRVV